MRAWCLLLASCCVVTQAQNAWVNRRRKGDNIGRVRMEEPEQESSFGDFNKLNQMMGDLQEKGLEMPRAAGGGGVGADMAGLQDLMKNMEGVDLANIMQQGAKMFEGMLDMPEVKQIMEDPVALKQALTDNPMLDAMPGMREMFDKLLESDELKDPEKFKQTMAAGIEQFKSLGSDSLAQMGELLADPAKLQATMGEMMNALEPEQRAGLEALMSGDFAGLQKMGADALAGALDDPSALEEARQQMLQNMDNPLMQQMLAAGGADVRAAVNDPEQWRRLVQQQMEGLTGDPTGAVHAGGFSGGIEL